MHINTVIIRPVLTEKSTQMVAKQIYTFLVHPRATKSQIKSVVQSLYPVTVSTVRMSNRKGKMRKVGKKQTPHQMPGKSIAYITVTKGKIDVFPQA